MERRTEEKIREILRLKRLLETTELFYTERKLIEAKIESLEREIYKALNEESE